MRLGALSGRMVFFSAGVKHHDLATMARTENPTAVATIEPRDLE
jgi:hypothetical protein